MFTARVASKPGGTKCATARKLWCATPNFSHVHTPADPTRTPECGNVSRKCILQTARGRGSAPPPGHSAHAPQA
eukprot:5475468-Prymnesium_polylepis.1